MKEITDDIEVYRDDRYVLGLQDGIPYLVADEKHYELSCHPYEPCTYIKEGGVPVAVIHNAFDPDAVLKAFSCGKMVEAVTGKQYTPKEFCVMLAFAAERLFDTDIGYVEGAIAVEKLKVLGAISPETAVYCADIGVRTISDGFSHSKKLTERVMYTEDGKVYLRIKK